MPVERLQAILGKNDKQLDWSDFRDIFHLTVIGTYRECAYFLPSALHYIRKHPDDALECSTNIIWFISHHEAELRSDELYEKCADGMKACLRIWSSDFKVVHYDLRACKAKGWSLEHADIVGNSQLILESLQDLAYYKSMTGVAFDFLEYLCTCDKPLHSAWYLELCSSDLLYHVVEDFKLKGKLSDRAAIHKCAGIVLKAMVPAEYSPTYWKDVFSRLEMAKEYAETEGRGN